GRPGYSVHYWSNSAPRLWPLERPRQCGATPGLYRLPAPDPSEQSPGHTAAWDRLPHRSHTGYSGPECLAFRVPGIRERLPFAHYAPLYCGVRRGYYALAPLVNFSLRHRSVYRMRVPSPSTGEGQGGAGYTVCRTALVDISGVK